MASVVDQNSTMHFYGNPETEKGVGVWGGESRHTKGHGEQLEVIVMRVDELATPTHPNG